MSGPDAIGNPGIRHLSHASDAKAAGQPELKTERDKKMWQTSLKFEAMFVQQMFSEMHKSVPKSGFLPSGFAEDVHNSMMDQAVAESGSHSGSLGIAPSIYQQLQQMSQAQVSPAPADTMVDPNGNERGEHHGAD